MTDEYYLEQDQFIRSFEISQNDSYSLLLGAGASITSGVPSAIDCIWEWKKNIYSSQTGRNSNLLDIKSGQVRNQIQGWLNGEGIYPPENNPSEYSFYVEQCYPIEEDRRKFFQRISERKSPSVGYKLVNLLHKAGIVKSVWTTNFDDLCRDAGIIIGNVVVDISLETVDRIFRPQNNQELLLIKLHGDYKYGPLKNTDEELKTQDSAFRNKLIDYLNDKHLIVSGYSGRDDSIMDALIESYSKPGAGRLLWCGYGRGIPEKVLTLLKTARDGGRTAYYIPTDGFDSLFISLAASCTKSNDQLSIQFQDCIKAVDTEDIRSKFTITVPRTNAIIKSNLFEIQFPQEVFQFEINYNEGEKPWQTLREITQGKNVVAVPFKKMVWALGTLTDINNFFSQRLKGKISRVPIADINIYKDTAFITCYLRV